MVTAAASKIVVFSDQTINPYHKPAYRCNQISPAVFSEEHQEAHDKCYEVKCCQCFIALKHVFHLLQVRLMGPVLKCAS